MSVVGQKCIKSPVPMDFPSLMLGVLCLHCADIIWMDAAVGGLELVELSPPDPWLADPRDAQELEAGEVTVSMTDVQTPHNIQGPYSQSISEYKSIS